MSITQITQEKISTLRRKSTTSAPTRPGDHNYKAGDVKHLFIAPLLDPQDSVVQEVNRIVEEANGELASANSAIGGKVDKTTTINGHSLSANVTLTPADLGLSAAYNYKGSVADYDSLPSSGLSAGDVYNVVAAHGNYPKGTNYAWNGSAWDPLGGEFDTSDLQVKTGWAHDTSATSISYTMDDNKVKAFGASGITSITLSLPSSVSIGYMSMVCVKHGATPPTYTFVNNTGKTLVFVQYGVKVNEYVPSPNTKVRFMPSCVDGETIEMLILEISNE